MRHAHVLDHLVDEREDDDVGDRLGEADAHEHGDLGRREGCHDELCRARYLAGEGRRVEQLAGRTGDVCDRREVQCCAAEPGEDGLGVTFSVQAISLRPDGIAERQEREEGQVKVKVDERRSVHRPSSYRVPVRVGSVSSGTEAKFFSVGFEKSML